MYNQVTDLGALSFGICHSLGHAGLICNLIGLESNPSSKAGSDWFRLGSHCDNLKEKVMNRSLYDFVLLQMLVILWFCLL